MEKIKVYQQLGSFCKNEEGNITLFQWPNLPLIGWVTFKILATVVETSNIKSGFQSLSTASLLIWAYLEISSGASYYRRALGAVIMVSVVVGYFR